MLACSGRGVVLHANRSYSKQVNVLANVSEHVFRLSAFELSRHCMNSPYPLIPTEPAGPATAAAAPRELVAGVLYCERCCCC